MVRGIVDWEFDLFRVLIDIGLQVFANDLQYIGTGQAQLNFSFEEKHTCQLIVKPTKLIYI